MKKKILDFKAKIHNYNEHGINTVIVDELYWKFIIQQVGNRDRQTNYVSPFL